MKRARNANPLPTSRDAIESWLDVLVSMLSLTNSHKAQVRDELEDHLRSRVDDLLILGKPEPEAIQTAIHELGETAELAKLISSASRTGPSFRRFAMNATFFVLAGSILTASVSMMMPTSTNLIPQTTTAIVIDDHEQNPLVNQDAFRAFTIDVRTASISDLFTQLHDHMSKPMIVHWDMLEELGFDRETPIGIDADPLTAKLVLTILEERTERDMSNSIAVLEEDEHVEIGLRSQFDRRTTTKRIYDLSGFADRTSQANPASSARGGISSNQLREQRTEHKLNQIIDLLQTHVSRDDWASMGGDLASLSALDTTLIVSAPERMHEEIRSLLEELQAQHIAQTQEQMEQRTRAMHHVRAVFREAKDQYLKSSGELRRLQVLIQNTEQRLFDGTINEDELEVIQKEQENLGFMLQELQIEANEAERRYERYQSLLIDAEQELLMSELN